MQKTPPYAGVKLKALLPLFFSIALAGCGGGGGGHNSEPTPPPVTSAPTEPLTPLPDTSGVAPSCTGCGALSNTAYSGSGVGIWHKKNTGTSPEDVEVAITGLASNTVTLIFTNETGAEVVMPSIPMLSATARPSVFSASASAPAPKAEGLTAVTAFNLSGWKSLISSPKIYSSFTLARAAPQLSVIGDTRAFKYHDGSSRVTTLGKQSTMADGVVVRFWVESSESSESKVSGAILEQLATAFTNPGGAYDMLMDISGPLWGSHGYGELISGVEQPIDIVLLNFVKDNQPYGEVGYFHALNNFKKSVLPDSNESISLYLDTETTYLGGTSGIKLAKATLAHEGLHLANFYRRGVKQGPAYQYDTWLEEMTAMMMEDAAGSALEPSSNSIRDMRYPEYLSSASYNCSLLDFTGFGDTCESYSVSGSFGGFLLRQMGVPFFKNLLNQSESGSEAALQSAIRAFRPQSSLGEELRKFAIAAIPALPSNGAPAGFDFPARIDGVYSIPVINAEAYKQYRVLPVTVPTTLKAYANFPVVRATVSGTFKETVRVPAGATLSVVIN